METVNLTSAQDIGNYLESVRTSLGISQEEIAYQTKISLYFIRAIEKGEWEKIGHRFFIVSFIKSYCETVGIPWNNLSSRVIEIAKSLDKGESCYKRLLAQKPPLFKGNKNFFFYSFVMFMCVVMTVGGIYIANRDNQLKSSERKVMEEDSGLPIGLLNKFQEFQPVQPINPDSNPQNVKEAMAKTTKEAIEAGVFTNGHRLFLEATKDTWVKVWVDDKKPVSKLMAHGDRMEFEVKQKVTVIIGNPAGIKIGWDNEIFEHHGKKGKILKITLPVDISKLRKN